MAAGSLILQGCGALREAGQAWPLSSITMTLAVSGNYSGTTIGGVNLTGSISGGASNTWDRVPWIPGYSSGVTPIPANQFCIAWTGPCGSAEVLFGPSGGGSGSVEESFSIGSPPPGTHCGVTMGPPSAGGFVLSIALTGSGSGRQIQVTNAQVQIQIQSEDPLGCGDGGISEIFSPGFPAGMDAATSYASFLSGGVTITDDSNVPTVNVYTITGSR